MEIVFRAITSAEHEPGLGEVVERKGIGHPDTVCDALAESLSRALSRFYLERFGLVLHHNVDKVLLWAGRSRPAFGGGEVVEPIEIFLAGRATLEHRGVRVPIRDIAEETCRAWLAANLHALDAHAHVRIHTLIRPGSHELVDLFLRERREGRWLANDTSLGVGFAPLSPLEQAVLAAEESLNAPGTRTAHPAIGEDVKVMAARLAEGPALTVGCAMVDRHLTDLDAYVAARAAAARIASLAAERELGEPASVRVNAGDSPSGDSIFLTVTGTSAEAGDDGQAGRGNRANGLITPGRPMTLESVAGKNPITHVGKLYNVLGQRLAQSLVDQIAGVTGARCTLLSRIGHPIDDPPLVTVGLVTERGEIDADTRRRAADVVRGAVGGVTSLWRDFLAGTCRVA
ncbi:MAG: methionine adenosyltransferase [Ectothiorhodospiraceae bacterium]|nr:methionine adenosyltransferase [Ectothiorhodospiraceae bacterium]